MNVTRDVITDLLPLYFAGEASEDTRALVERFFEHDPEFARLARENSDNLLPVETPVTLTRENEMKTLEKTRRLVRMHGALLGLSTFLCFLPLAFRFDSGGVHWLWAGFPAGAAIPLALGVLGWVGYLAMRRHLRATGL